MGIDGVSISNKDEYIVCHINTFSDELMDIIRKRLTSICHGIYNSSLEQKSKSYKNTIRSFIQRYYNKNEQTQKGMIGELLTHILVGEILKNHTSSLPFFNLEEKSIKKDLI